MTNYEKIKFLLEMGVYKGVEVKTKRSTIIFPIYKLNGFALYSEHGDYYDQFDIRKLNITSITPIPNPPKLLPVGTKVRVFEDWLFYDRIYEIVGVSTVKAIYTINTFHDKLEVPARAVVPVFE